MEDGLSDLIAALDARPSSALLLAMLAEAHEAVDATAAVDWLQAASPAAFNTRGRKTAVEFLCTQTRHDLALNWADADAPELMLARASCLHELGRNVEALDVYRRAVEIAPELADSALETRISPMKQAGSASSVVVDLHGNPLSADNAASLPELQPVEKVSFADVSGLEDVKRQIHRRIIVPMQKPSIFEKFKRKAGGGLLLYGPPGCGKTMMARATAGEAGAKFYQVEIATILDMYIGESEKRLAAVFETARANAPAVIFFDEIEALAARRRYGENDARASLVSTFLTEMDGFSSTNSGALVLAASNVPWSIDSAFLRPGRFDRSLFVPPPDAEARQAILELLISERPTEPGLDLAPLVQRTSGFSGADLCGLIEEACDLAIERSIDTNSVEPINAYDLRDALNELKPSTLDWLAQARNYVRFSNESGFYDDVARFLKQHSK